MRLYPGNRASQRLRSYYVDTVEESAAQKRSTGVTRTLRI